MVSDETNEAVVIDCGAFYPEERTAIVKYLRNGDLVPKRLIATHGHVDHNFGNDTIFAAFGLRPEVHQKDAQLMASLPEQAMAFCKYRMEGDIPQVGNFFCDGDTICFGKHELCVLPTPGHTPGSVFFLCEEEGVAFSGDTLFRMSIGRTDLGQGSFADIMASLQGLKHRLGGKTVILPGHGPQTTMGEEIAANPYLR